MPKSIPATVLRIIDGDTIEVTAHIWIDLAQTIRVRLKGIDAPEFSSPCQSAKSKAQAAKNLLRHLIGKAPVHLTQITPGKYARRVVANVITATGTDLGKALLKAGLARRYDGGKREGWC